MRPERNPLDLNNLPDDYSTRDGKQPSEDSSSCVAGGGGGGGGYRKKKSGGKDECGKVYECRFCSLKFCKSQALGGHMNRHRQERETETLNRARQLVFSNDNLSSTHLGGQPITHGGFHQTPGGNIGDSAALPAFRSSIYQPRLFPAAGSTSNILQQPPPPPPAQPQPYLYASPSSRLVTYPSQQYPPHSHPAVNEYYVGHVLSSNPSYVGGPQPQQPESNYTCIGAPVGHGFGSGTDMGAIGGGGGGGGGGGRDGSLQNQRRLDPSPMINRFQDGF